MGEISDAATIEALRGHLARAAARQVVAASNLANANTPGYRAQEVDFSDALSRQLDTPPLVRTSPAHLSGAPAGATQEPPTREATGLEARRDGNTVQIDRELLTMTQAAGQFARAQTALAAKFRLLRYAIAEGR